MVELLRSPALTSGASCPCPRTAGSAKSSYKSMPAAGGPAAAERRKPSAAGPARGTPTPAGSTAPRRSAGTYDFANVFSNFGLIFGKL